jgi:TRAP-type C4-dicarboxylate transport system permease small subunit
MADPLALGLPGRRTRLLLLLLLSLRLLLLLHASMACWLLTSEVSIDLHQLHGATAACQVPVGSCGYLVALLAHLWRGRHIMYYMIVAAVTHFCVLVNKVLPIWWTHGQLA